MLYYNRIDSLNYAKLRNANLVHPNPAKNYTIFTFTQTPVILSLYNSYGQLVFNEEILDKRFRLNTKHFGTGVYFYSYNSKESVNSSEGDGENGPFVAKNKSRFGFECTKEDCRCNDFSRGMIPEEERITVHQNRPCRRLKRGATGTYSR